MNMPYTFVARDFSELSTEGKIYNLRAAKRKIEREWLDKDYVTGIILPPMVNRKIADIILSCLAEQIAAFEDILVKERNAIP